MKTSRLLPALLLFCATVVMAAPRDPIDPATLKDKVSLTLGAKGTIQFTRDGDTLATPVLVKGAGEKQPGISVEFTKHPEFIALNLQNRLPKALRYRAAIRLKGRRDFVETSLIVPVQAGLVSFETWQDPVEEIILFEFKQTDEKL